MQNIWLAKMEEEDWRKHWLNFTEWEMEEGSWKVKLNSWKKQESDISWAPRK
jgi:hypothetical protein